MANQMVRVIMIGARGTAVVVAEQLQDAIARFGVSVGFLGYAFDDKSLGDKVNGLPILCGTRDVMERFGSDNSIMFMFQMYRPDKIEERIGWLQATGVPTERMFTFVHPSAYVAPSARLGPGVVVCAGAVVNPNAVLGKCVTVNSAVLIGHDSIVEDYAFISGHCAIGSNARVGQAAFIGLNSTLRNEKQIGAGAIIGSASNVVNNVSSRAVAYGNPAIERDGLNNVIR